MKYVNTRTIAILVSILVLSSAAAVIGLEVLHFTGDTRFCMSCHEMRVVGEQGWMLSPHYMNPKGVVAQCADCHIPPETDIFRMMWVKGRDGTKDVYVHLLGRSEPHEMDWERLSESARRKIHDSSCLACHANITAKGISMKALIPHREYGRYKKTSAPKACVDCHTEEFHGRFKQYLFEKDLTAMTGGEK